MRSRNKKGTGSVPRVILSQSNRFLYVQAVDDFKRHTIESFSTLLISSNEEKEFSRKSIKYASEMGNIFSKKLGKENIKNIVFDRSGRVYHGRLKAFCEAMRRSGIEF